MEAPAPPSDLTKDHLAALDVFRAAKTFFLCLLLISAALHVGAWLVICHTDLLKPLKNRGTSTEPAAAADQAAVASAARWENAAQAATDFGGFLGRASGVILLGLFTLSLLTALSARAGGTAAMARACVWSTLAVAMLIPWETFSPSEGYGFPSAFYTAKELHNLDNKRAVEASTPEAAATGNGDDRRFDMPEVLRFAVYPLALMIVAVIAQLQYRKGYVAIVRAPGVRLQMREH